MKNHSGFTLIEIMMAVLVLSVGIAGVFAMQILSIRANQSANDRTIAVAIAEHYIARFKQDATRWTSSNPSDYSKTSWVKYGIWYQGYWVGFSLTPFSFSSIRKTWHEGVPRNQGKFCVDFYFENPPLKDRVLTGYVRVYWPKKSVGKKVLAHCGYANDPVRHWWMNQTKPYYVRKVRTYVNMVTLPFSLKLNIVPAGT